MRVEEPQVVVVGSVNVDLVVTLDRLPRRGETVSGGTLARHGGGKGGNQAIAAARAGARTALVAAVGADPEGRSGIAELEAEGVDCDAVAVVDGVPTGCALIAVDRRGDNQIAVAPGANRSLSTFPVALLAGAPGVLLLSFEAPDVVLDAATVAAVARGWRIIVNPAPVRPLTSTLAAAQPILVPNEHEVVALAGVEDPTLAARRLQESRRAPIVVTLGAAGALLVDDVGELGVPVPPVDAVDTTGAGDAFCGTLAARIAQGDALRDAVAVAVEVASRSTSARGARGA
jgi:ribokinase